MDSEKNTRADGAQDRNKSGEGRSAHYGRKRPYCRPKKDGEPNGAQNGAERRRNDGAQNGDTDFRPRKNRNFGDRDFQRREKRAENVNTGANENESEKENAPAFAPEISAFGENINISINENLREDGAAFGVTPENTMPREEETDPASLVTVIGVRFKPSGKVYYFDPGELKIKTGAYAVVETARGIEYGCVAAGNKSVRESDIVKPLRPVIRQATEEDKKCAEENKKKEKEAFVIGLRKIEAHGLDMKLVDVEYTFDNSKLLFYFTSAGRVDFRELVKDLASVFRTRIELRQIGIRDESKLMGGLGACGRPLCCARFLSDFVQVSIKMAKEQGLSLNSAKISGNCGRLMCCLRYEHESYRAELRVTPPVGALVRTEDGVGNVTEINPIAGLVRVKLNEKADAAPKYYKRDSVKVLKMPNKTDDMQTDLTEEPDAES